MALFGRLFRVVWGGEIDRALRPVLAVALAGSIAGSSLFTFMGIWAIKELGASGRSLGATFLVGAILAAAGGYLGGHLSDHFGRRRLILVGWGGSVLYIAALPPRRRQPRPRARPDDRDGRLRLDRQRRRPGDGRRPRPAGEARGGLRLRSGRLEPRRDARAAARRVDDPARRLERPLRRSQPARGGRRRARLPVHPLARGVLAGGTARAGLVRRDRARSGLPRLPALRDARVSRLRRLRGGAADLAHRHARALADAVGVPRDHQPRARHPLPAAPDAARERDPRGARSSSSRCC